MTEQQLNDDGLSTAEGIEYSHESSDHGAADMVVVRVDVRRADLDAALASADDAAVLVAWIASHIGT